MDYAAFPFEIKTLSDGGRIEGVISAFNGLDAYGDTIERGAYSKSLEAISKSGRKLPVLYQHDRDRPIGVWSELRQTDEGLLGAAELAMEVPDAKAAHALAKIGALTGISIGYNIPPGGSRLDGNKRVLSTIELVEASLVTFPADHNARVTAVKSISGPADIEELFRERGFTGRKAKAAASAAWKASQQDGEPIAEIIHLFEEHAARLAAIGGR